MLELSKKLAVASCLLVIVAPEIFAETRCRVSRVLVSYSTTDSVQPLTIFNDGECQEFEKPYINLTPLEQAAWAADMHEKGKLHARGNEYGWREYSMNIPGIGYRLILTVRRDLGFAEKTFHKSKILWVEMRTHDESGEWRRELQRSADGTILCDRGKGRRTWRRKMLWKKKKLEN